MKSGLLTFITLFTLLTSYGCGQKSHIKNSVTSNPLKNDHSLVISFTEEEMGSFSSPVEKVGVIAAGFAKMFFKLGADLKIVKDKAHFTLIQQIPKLPSEYIEHIKIKRIFFYIEPIKDNKVSFDFIGKLAVKLSSIKVEDPDSWKPIFVMNEIPRRENTEFMFVHPTKEIAILKYDNETSKADLRNISRGKTYIINNNDPKETKDFLLTHPKLQGYFTRIHILNKSVLVELKKDPVVEDGFQDIILQESETISRLGIHVLDACTTKNCFDFKVSDSDILPLLNSNNGIKIDGFLQVDKVPPSFKLKGFVEFDIKTKLPF